MRNFNVFRPEYTVKNLLSAFIKRFFQLETDLIIDIPELRGYEFTDDLEGKLINISEIFTGQGTEDKLNDLKQPLILLSYPEFNEISKGIGSEVNRQDGYFISGPTSETFWYDDIIENEKVKLSYATDERRWWKTYRYHFQFNLNIDIITNSITSRQDISDLIRALFSQYLAELTPTFYDASVPFVLQGYEYQRIPNEKYPIFFPYHILGVFFDDPKVLGEGTYDTQGAEVSEQQLYLSSLTVENFRLEAFRLVEKQPVRSVKMSKEPTVINVEPEKC